jgi:hypothetical protein
MGGNDMTTATSGREQVKFTGLSVYGKGRQYSRIIMVVVVLLGTAVPFTFGSNGSTAPEASSKVSESAMDREMAELVKVYRTCLQKYEDTPMKAKENCGLYKDAIREFSPTNLRNIVTELLDGLRENCEKGGN